MYSRADAVRAREATEHYRSANMIVRVSPAASSHKTGRLLQTVLTFWLTFRQTRWGVGFGPRDCSNYQTGISVVPIDRLTDADRKWLVTAEYGGTGGVPIAQHQEVEEPDIEIGAGVSSKGQLHHINKIY